MPDLDLQDLFVIELLPELGWKSCKKQSKDDKNGTNTFHFSSWCVTKLR